MTTTEAANLILKQKPISSQFWGKDHWSMLAYLESCAVERNDSRLPVYDGDPEALRQPLTGRINILRIRFNTLTKSYVGQDRTREWSDDWSSALRDGQKAPDGHDDIDCARDLEREGLVVLIDAFDTGLFKMTARGIAMAHQIRTHKALGGSFGGFIPNWLLIEGGQLT